jgi:hypothetical protein
MSFSIASTNLGSKIRDHMEISNLTPLIFLPQITGRRQSLTAMGSETGCAAWKINFWAKSCGNLSIWFACAKSAGTFLHSEQKDGN